MGHGINFGFHVDVMGAPSAECQSHLLPETQSPPEGPVGDIKHQFAGSLSCGPPTSVSFLGTNVPLQPFV